MALIHVYGHREIARWRAEDGRCYVLTWSLHAGQKARLLFRPKRGAALRLAGKIDAGIRRQDAERYAASFVRLQHPGERFQRVQRSSSGGWVPA